VCLLVVCALAPFAGAQAPGPPSGAQEVTFPGGDLQLRGFLWRPQGAGPFPAMLWNHGSEKLPGWLPQVAPVLLERGYVFFVPHRRGHGRSPGPYILDQIEAAAPAERGALLVRLHDLQLGDQMAALDFLKAQSFVDANRLTVAGCSYGGIQTMLAAERGAGYRGAVNFAGAAKSWKTVSELRTRLLGAARNARVPVFFIQAENDFDLTPSRALSEEMQRAGKPHQVKFYPPSGTTNQDSHDFCVKGASVWAGDVFSFLDTHLR
jgi:dienelactone hydrolase